MPHPFFFGYGSLVNKATHDYPDAMRARITGWRRCWRHTTLRELAFLSVTKVPGVEIDGLIAAVPGGDWAALDERERAYERHPLAKGEIEHPHTEDILVHIYSTQPSIAAPRSVRHPVLLSYLDTVVCGFFDLFGEDGVRRFFDTTEGWDVRVLDDRNTPIYPRAISTTQKERRRIDAALDALEVPRFRR